MIHNRIPTTIAFFLGFSVSVLSGAETPSFNADVRPLLAAKCFACHGPDEEAREADLRLDLRDHAVAAGAITPHQPDASELLDRINSDDEFLRMPPPEAGEPLTVKERNILREWIASGAKYEQHWAFVPPVRPDVPEIDNPRWQAWSRNPIDRFVLNRLLTNELSPSPAADRYTLVRRVYLDLIGLPPTPAEADAFVNDADPSAYERLVDRLLASPRYGEHWTRPWLDLARYADTNGYEKDRPRSVWPYRNWVIEALNADKPFDQFTIEQLAGDMLQNPTTDQRIATGFHRQTMLNEEGGIDPLEFRFYAMVDRVATTGTVWMGLTLGCAQCHTHKYDPITHTDYYRFMALLNNADEPDLAVPISRIVERRQTIQNRIDKLESKLATEFPSEKMSLQQALETWIEQERQTATDWTVLLPSSMRTNLPKLEQLDDGSILSTGDITKRDVFQLAFDLKGFDQPIIALRLEVLPDERLPARGPGRAYYEGRKGDFFLSEVTAQSDGQPIAFGSASHSYGKISVGSGSADAANVIDGEGSTGWSTSGGEGEPHQLVLIFEEPWNPSGTLEIQMLFERHFAASLGRFRISATTDTHDVQAKTLPVDVERILANDPTTWTVHDRQMLRQQFLRETPLLADARKPIDTLRKQLPDLPVTLVMQERDPENPRATHRHHRGEYLSPREPVSPGVPSIFAENSGNQPNDRLSLARWLVSDRNPLASRVTVNRDWREFFGAGLMRTNGDFGTQSEPPTHPELLDWLAREFVDGGWSRKRLHRLIVTSATYRQASELTREMQERDPGNRLLARGPRFRVRAETVRDIMLQASGRLSSKMGGPSVYPPQPNSVTALAYGNTSWTPSQGDDRYRRSLYTFLKRTAPFAANAVFDAPSGETCLARRDRSNTPLQALTLLNDEMFLELSRALGREVVRTHPQSPHDAATRIFRRLLTRPPTDAELQLLLDYYAQQLARLQRGELDAASIAADPQATPEIAAWMMVARAVMNLDEVITKS
ncbi:PSD1 and planctomycete cytochrome C domain-containing protein [Thalassoroseus pseudoceratinae]|uniref:PSD1 and planctomycete cytochrome C domain-containing protein n=1 Tax=Thalassoroseus pseudoceratinae TaxID=2713176 RepID=UPI001421769C|nr:PSD1 and planctomycete cytochrome C domain-containing protein [Thalassoroseus pseudoceratinae]